MTSSGDLLPFDQEIDPEDIAKYLEKIEAAVPSTSPVRRVLPSRLPEVPQPKSGPRATHTERMAVPASRASDNFVRQVAKERLRRENESLRLFEPLPTQSEFLTSPAYIRMLLGGNRCLGGETEIYDPVANAKRRIDEIDGIFHVLSIDMATSRQTVQRASKPFIKGTDKLYRVTLSGGREFVATLEHRLATANGEWASVQDALTDRAPLMASVATSDPPRVTSVEFLRDGDVWDISVPPHDNYVLAGIVHHNSGKTLTGAVECARVVTNQAGPGYPNKGVFVVVGRDYDTISQGIYPTLCEPGAFKVIRDPETKRLRSFRPWEDWDKAHASHARPADPLIPDRLIKKRGWVNAARKQIARITLHTGWTLLFYSGEGIPKPGFRADFGWLDEEVTNGLWPRELRMRLIDRNGRMFWTATPENSTPALYDLWCQFLAGDADIQAWTISTENHQYHDAQALKKMLKGITAEDYETKVQGRFRMSGALVFPEFSWAKHSCKRFDVPSHWTRYLAIDPGFNPCTVLFMAVPPKTPISDRDKGHSGHVYVYDELVIPECSAELLAKKLKERIGTDIFERFIIDHQGGRTSQAGSGETIENQYRSAFKKFGITSSRQGSAFTAGLNDPRARINAIREWLSGDDPYLRIFDGLGTTRMQMERYHFSRDRTGLLTDKPVARNNHCVDDLGMLAAYDPQYEAPDPRTPRTWVERLLQKKRQAQTPEDTRSQSFGPRAVK